METKEDKKAKSGNTMISQNVENLVLLGFSLDGM